MQLLDLKRFGRVDLGGLAPASEKTIHSEDSKVPTLR